MGAAPLPDALDVGGAGEGIAVAWLVEPAVLAGGFARLPALGLRAVALAPSATRVGIKEGLTVLALTLTQWTSHWPASPQVNERKIVAQKEENGAEKNKPKPSEENGRRG